MTIFRVTAKANKKFPVMAGQINKEFKKTADVE